MVYVQAVLLCIVVCNIASTQAGYDYSYLEDNCNDDPNQWVIYLGRNGVSTYGVVQLMRHYYGEYGVNYNCSLKLVPPAGYTINIVVDKIEIYPYLSCSPDYLEISNDVIAVRYCGTNTNDQVLTMDNYAVVRFVSGYTLHRGYNGFYLYYNLFHNNSCSTNEHACVNNRCILSELTCDDKNNCGDYTDEKRTTCPLPGWAIFLIVLGSLVVVVLIVVTVVKCYMRCCCCNRSKRTTVHNVYPQVYAVSTTTSNEEPIAMASHLSPPPPYSEVVATAISDTNDKKQQYNV